MASRSALIKQLIRIARSMTIAVPDFPCLWAEVVNMAAYLKEQASTQTPPIINNTLQTFSWQKTNNITP
jgi:hypothetical protein